MVGKERRKKNQKPSYGRHKPLDIQIRQEDQPYLDHDGVETSMVAKHKKQRQLERNIDEESSNSVVGNDLSQKIIGQAREQLHEIEREEKHERKTSREPTRSTKFEADDDDDDAISEGEMEEYQDYLQELDNITEEDERALAAFSRDVGPAPGTITLADIIMEKIREKEMRDRGEIDPDRPIPSGLDPKLVAVYQSVGKILSRYSSGKLPKAFKIIPSLSNWEEILYLTEPENWSPIAVRQATKIFASNFNAKLAQRFYNVILLPYVMHDMREHKKLNFHLYLALRKALFKPAAFYKGILLPLAQSGKCTLREGTIIASVLSKVSVPVLHSSAAILKLAQMDYTGTNSLFLRVLLNKKYALPYRVIDALVQHFAQFTNEKRKLPVLWQQAFLTFVQRYKTDLLPQQKSALKKVVSIHPHPYFSDEIRRELAQSKDRGEEEGVSKMEF